MNKVSNLVASVVILTSLARECWAVSDFNETYSAVETMVLDENSIPMAYSDTPFVGQILQLYFYLRDELVFKDLLIQSCTAYNNLADTDPKPWKLLERGCPTQSGKLVTKAQEVRMHVKTLLNGTRVQTHGKVLPIKAFLFTGSSSIKMDCSYKVCKQDEISECQLPVNCGEIGHKDHAALADTLTQTSGETPNETEAARREKRTARNTRNAAGEEKISVLLTMSAYERQAGNITI